MSQRQDVQDVYQGPRLFTRTIPTANLFCISKTRERGSHDFNE